jgi:hypothetical protein
VGLRCREMALDIEGVVDRRVSGKKSLRRAWTLETLHLALSSPSWLMRILGAVVFPSTPLVAIFDPELAAAAPQERSSSVIIRSGTKAYFFRSLRISFSAACLFRLDWTSTSRDVVTPSWIGAVGGLEGRLTSGRGGGSPRPERLVS